MGVGTEAGELKEIRGLRRPLRLVVGDGGAEGRRRAEAFSEFAYVSQSADVAQFALFFE